MKTIHLPAILSIAIATTVCQTAFAADGPAYLDDRSSPEALVRSLYNAINRHEYARAWDYFGEAKPAKDFAAFVKGYEGTGTVDVETGGASEQGAAGSIYYSIAVAIKAAGADGKETVFAGCYTLRQVNGQTQEPPFDPLHIEKGALKPSTASFDKALPESCGDGPPPPKKDSVLEQAKKDFAAAYGEQCDKELPGGGVAGEPEAFTIRYKESGAKESDPDRETRLFRFFCSMAAYNESAVYYIQDETTGLRQLQFTVPELDIRYENGNSEGKVEAINIVGFQTDDQLVNSNYDDETKSITALNKWRSAGDASASGTYLFRNGNFSLVQYDVDASFDGEMNPATVIDYNSAP